MWDEQRSREGQHIDLQVSVLEIVIYVNVLQSVSTTD